MFNEEEIHWIESLWGDRVAELIILYFLCEDTASSYFCCQQLSSRPTDVSCDSLSGFAGGNSPQRRFSTNPKSLCSFPQNSTGAFSPCWFRMIREERKIAPSPRGQWVSRKKQTPTHRSSPLVFSWDEYPSLSAVEVLEEQADAARDFNVCQTTQTRGLMGTFQLSSHLYAFILVSCITKPWALGSWNVHILTQRPCCLKKLELRDCST